MTKIFTGLAVSVDGFITGRGAGPGRGLGDGGTLFDWYGDPANSSYFQGISDRVGAVVTGRTTYDDCEGFGGNGPHPTAPMVVVSHRPAPVEFVDSERQVFAGSIGGAIEKARELAGGKDVGIQGGVTLTAALAEGLLDELILHQVPVLMGEGRRYFGALPEHVDLSLVETVQGAGVTHLHYAVVRP